MARRASPAEGVSATCQMRRPGGINCAYCSRDITRHIRITCAECRAPRVHHCLDCFSVGAALNPHKPCHDYLITQDLEGSLFQPGWNAEEEQRLLDAICIYGPFSWSAVATHVETKSALKCESHYNTVYLESQHAPLPFSVDVVRTDVSRQCVRTPVNRHSRRSAGGEFLETSNFLNLKRPRAVTVRQQRTKPDKFAGNRNESKSIFHSNCALNLASSDDNCSATGKLIAVKCSGVVRKQSCVDVFFENPQSCEAEVSTSKNDERDDVSTDDSDEDRVDTDDDGTTDDENPRRSHRTPARSAQLRQRDADSPKCNRISPPHTSPARQSTMGHSLDGFFPKRGEFEVEWDDTAEDVIADLEVEPNDTMEEINMKLRLIEIYNERLGERERIKSLLLSRNLLNFSELQSAIDVMPVDQQQVARWIKRFARLVPQSDFVKFQRLVVGRSEARKNPTQICNNNCSSQGGISMRDTLQSDCDCDTPNFSASASSSESLGHDTFRTHDVPETLLPLRKDLFPDPCQHLLGDNNYSRQSGQSVRARGRLPASNSCDTLTSTPNDTSLYPGANTTRNELGNSPQRHQSELTSDASHNEDSCRQIPVACKPMKRANVDRPNQARTLLGRVAQVSSPTALRLPLRDTWCSQNFSTDQALIQETFVHPMEPSATFRIRDTGTAVREKRASTQWCGTNRGAGDHARQTVFDDCKLGTGAGDLGMFNDSITANQSCRIPGELSHSAEFGETESTICLGSDVNSISRNPNKHDREQQDKSCLSQEPCMTNNGREHGILALQEGRSSGILIDARDTEALPGHVRSWRDGQSRRSAAPTNKADLPKANTGSGAGSQVIEIDSTPITQSHPSHPVEAQPSSHREKSNERELATFEILKCVSLFAEDDRIENEPEKQLAHQRQKRGLNPDSIADENEKKCGPRKRRRFRNVHLGENTESDVIQAIGNNQAVVPRCTNRQNECTSSKSRAVRTLPSSSGRYSFRLRSGR